MAYTIAQRDQLLEEFNARVDADYSDGVGGPDDYTALEEMEGDEQYRTARAFLQFWRAESRSPGFMQPPGMFVQLVEGICGEEWR